MRSAYRVRAAVFVLGVDMQRGNARFVHAGFAAGRCGRAIAEVGDLDAIAFEHVDQLAAMLRGMLTRSLGCASRRPCASERMTTTITVAIWSIVVYSPIAHWVWSPSGWLAGIGTLLSAYFILAANAWMQHPVGYEINPETGRAVLTDIGTVLFQNTAVIAFFHTITAAFLVAGVAVAGVGAWMLTKAGRF